MTNKNSEQNLKSYSYPVISNERINSKGVGTLIYCAPEILSGDEYPEIDKTDVFSFGMLMYHVFTGKEPYSEPPYDKYSKWGNKIFFLLYF